MKEVKPGVPPTSEELLESHSQLLQQLIEANSIMAVALLRIYDVLASHYAEVNAGDAQDLVELHLKGQIRGDIPFLDPNHIDS